MFRKNHIFVTESYNYQYCMGDKSTKKSLWASLSNSIAFILSGLAIVITLLIGIAGGGGDNEDDEKDA